jgi:cell wall assembly regulator SMI1
MNAANPDDAAAGPTAPVSESWSRIDAWLAAHAPVSLARLRPGATPAELAAAEQVLGTPLPADLAASLACHDGLADEAARMLPDMLLLPVKGVVEQWELRCEVNAELLEDEPDEEPLRMANGEPYWHPLWIPVAHFQGDLEVIDMRPGPGQGRLGWSSHDGSSNFQGWPSLGAYLQAVADVLMTGRETSGSVGGWGPPLLSSAGELVWFAGLSGPDEKLRPAPVGLPA